MAFGHVIRHNSRCKQPDYTLRESDFIISTLG